MLITETYEVGSKTVTGILRNVGLGVLYHMKQEWNVYEENSKLIGHLKNYGLQFLTKEKHTVVQNSKKE